MARLTRGKANSEKGFIEIEYLIAAGLMVILVGSVSAGIAMMSRFQKSNDAASDSYYLLQRLMTVVKTANTCSIALGGGMLTAPTSLSDPETPVSIPIDFGAGTMTVAAGTEPVTGVKIQKLSLVYNNLAPSSATAPAQVIHTTTLGDLKQYVLNLRLQTEKLAGTQSTGFTKAKDIPVSVIVDSSNKIRFCEIDAAEARACAESGGKWNPSAPRGSTDPTNPRCIPRDGHCDIAGSFSYDPGGTMCGVENFPNPIQVLAGVADPYSCPAGFVRQRTGTIAESVQQSKDTVNNRFCAVYTCVRCSQVPDRSASITDAALVAPASVPNASVNSAIAAASLSQTNTTTSMQNGFTTFTGFP